MGEDDESGCGNHCYQQRKCYGCCCCVWTFVLIIVLSMSWDTLTPTEYGLLKNTISGAVDLTQVYTNGRHLVGPTQGFIKFPAERLTLSYGSNPGDDQVVIPARTGADGDSTSSSGGQPVQLSVSFQYRLVPQKIPQLFSTFSQAYETSYLRFAQQAVTNVAQSYTPRMFWENRAAIEQNLLTVVNSSLWTQGFAIVEHLQLRSVGFQSSYETTITNIQLQDQLTVTKSYQQLSTQVMTEIDIMQAETNAEIVEINADATRQRDVIIGAAEAAALEKEQSTRAYMYKQMKEHLGWTGKDFLQYVKMKALNVQPQAKVTVGVNAIGSMSPSR